MKDILDRYIFDKKDLRACYVVLDKSLSENHSHHHYPEALQKLLGQFMAACALLSSGLKFEGRLLLHLRSDSRVPLLMAECRHQQALRAYAQLSESDSDDAKASFADFDFCELRRGTLALTLQPDVGESYQGIVPLDGDNLAQCLQYYFLQSEQLHSHFYLSCEQGQAYGFMLQQLPAQLEKDVTQRQEHWREAKTLVDTLSTEELMALPSQEIMHRLFHQDDVRFLGQTALHFACSCSKAKMENALVSLGREELESILLEQGQIDIQCEFCQKGFIFDQEDVAALFLDKQVLH